MIFRKVLVLSTAISLAFGETNTSTTPTYTSSTPDTTTGSPTTTPVPTQNTTELPDVLTPGYMITLKSVVPELDKYLKANQSQYWTREERNQKIADFLKDETSKDQKPVLEELAKLGLDKYVSTFWLFNLIRVPDIPPYLLPKVKQIPGVIDVSKEEIASVDTDLTQNSFILAEINDPPKPNIVKVGADKLWNSNVKGAGILVGIIDTGVNVNHVCLKDNYAGKDGNNKVTWLDATKPVGFGSKIEFDDAGHGTHCTGTAVGKCGIGAAPESQFIACRALGITGGLESWMLTCMQFMSCSAENMEDSKARINCGPVPQIVSNSWTFNAFYKRINDLADIWTADKIFGVFAIGNQKQIANECGTARSPANQAGFFSVGATDNSDKVTDFSCRGPGNGTTCPFLVAPGKDIESASHTSNTGLATMSGTSMATPLVAGGIALLMSADKCYDAGSIESLIRKEGVDNGVTCDGDQTCGSARDLPNNVFGYGRLDLGEAFRAVNNHLFRPPGCTS